MKSFFNGFEFQSKHQLFVLYYNRLYEIENVRRVDTISSTADADRHNNNIHGMDFTDSFIGKKVSVVILLVNLFILLPLTCSLQRLIFTRRQDYNTCCVHTQKHNFVDISYILSVNSMSGRIILKKCHYCNPSEMPIKCLNIV